MQSDDHSDRRFCHIGGENDMERIIMPNGENSTECPCVTYTKVIDGRSFIVRVFLPAANAETMQEKIERMLHREIVNAIRQSAA